MVTLFTTHCPKCNVLKTKLDQKGVNYTEIDDVDEMLKRGFETAPVLAVDDKVMTFGEALQWVGEQ